MALDDTTAVIVAPDFESEGDDGPRRPYIVVLSGPQVGVAYKLTAASTTLGRSTDADISIVDEGISRLHVVITRRGNTFHMADQGSTNGTLLNGDKQAEAELSEGDKLQLGTNTVLKFTWQDALDERFQAAQYASATRDPLTGAFNRRYFEERLKTELSFAQRHDKPLSVAILDLDHFKQVNDTYGHLAGDEVLKRFSGWVRSQIRTDDVFGRYGGEEFVVLMRETASADAAVVLERIRALVAKSYVGFEDHQISVTVSIGMAQARSDENQEDGESLERLLERADKALYRAKENGRNRIEQDGAEPPP